MKKSFVLVFVLFAFISACGEQVDIKTETPDPVTLPAVTDDPPTTNPDPAPTTPPTIPPAPSQKPVEERVLLEGEGMESPGPWLLYSNGAGIGLVSQAGDEVGFMPEYWEYMAFQETVAPQGGLVAFVQGDLSDKFLKLLSLKDYAYLQTISLLGYEGEELNFDTERDAEDFAEDRYYAVGQPVWSSDGSKLAFVSAHLGPSPDVYIYDVPTNEVTRLTSGPAHAVDLTWSPDNKYIYHAGAEKLWMGYSGSGYSGWTFYSARADGSGVTTVYQSKIDQGHENIIGWHSDDDVLMDSGFWYCGKFDLRTVDIESGNRVSIWPDRYDKIAYDPVSKTAIVWVSPDGFSGDECGPTGESGLFLVSIPDGKQEKVSGFDEDDSVYSMDWDDAASRFLLEFKNAWAMVNLEGEIEYLKEKPFFSSNGEMTALLSLGYFGGSLLILDDDGNSIAIEMDGTVQYPTWSLDGNSLFFFVENPSRKNYDDLYLAKAPDFTPVLIAEELMAGPTAWVMP